jgi:hypothetical protein
VLLSQDPNRLREFLLALQRFLLAGRIPLTLSLSKAVGTLSRQLGHLLPTDQSRYWTWHRDHLIGFIVRNDITCCEISETPIYCQERVIIQIGNGAAIQRPTKNIIFIVGNYSGNQKEKRRREISAISFHMLCFAAFDAKRFLKSQFVGFAYIRLDY